ncbi:MAG: discoidin domain-containing protein [Planctomycetota bacterium]|nr:discoidin domain-containing protein [Planctomycetota bacterium]
MKSIMVAMALTVSVGPALQAEVPPKTYLVVELRDGSLVVGRPEQVARLPFDCVLGRVRFPVDRIANVEMHKDGEGALITTTKGDRINGHFDTGSLKVQSEGGVRALPLTSITRWHYDRGGNVGNVALKIRGTTVDGPSSYPENLLDGKTSGYHGTRGWSQSPTPATWTVTLPRPYPLRQIRLLLYDRDSRSFRYTIATSADGKTYETVADHSREWSRSWQDHSCPGRPVRYIQVRCLDSTYNSRPREGGFFAVELEAYCIPKLKPAIPGGSLSRLPTHFGKLLLAGRQD